VPSHPPALIFTHSKLFKTNNANNKKLMIENFYKLKTSAGITIFTPTTATHINVVHKLCNAKREDRRLAGAFSQDIENALKTKRLMQKLILFPLHPKFLSQKLV
jgi:hypothetical protein